MIISSSSPRVRPIFWLALILLAALAARVVVVARTPLFYDESQYLRRALAFPARVPETLAEGKFLQELFLAPLVRLPGDPLYSARAFSIVCGLATIVLLWWIGSRVGHSRGGLLAGVLYAGAPIAVLHDALAIPDSLLALIATVVLWACVRFATHPQPGRREAALIGFSVGTAALVKLPGLLLLAWPIIAILVYAPTASIRRTQASLLPTMFVCALACVAALAPFHYGGGEQSKMSGDFLAARVRNIVPVLIWLARYLPLPILVAPIALLATRLSTPATRKLVGWLLLAGIAIVAAFIAVGATLAPRYLVPAWPPLVLACGIALAELWRASRPKRAIATVVLVMALAWDGASLAMLARSPVDNLLAALDQQQYYQRWTAGYGTHELVAAIRQQADHSGALTLIEHDQPRLVHNIGRIYLGGDARISIVQTDLLLADAPQFLDTLAQHKPVFVAIDRQEAQAFNLATRFPHLARVAEFPNPYSNESMYLYHVVPE